MPKRTLLPKRLVSRNVFLEPELWEAHKIISSFHSDVFKELGANQGIPRNDMIKHFLTEDAVEYWRDKGGFPKDAEDWARKVKEAAKKLLQEMKKREEERQSGASDEEALIESISKFPKT